MTAEAEEGEEEASSEEEEEGAACARVIVPRISCAICFTYKYMYIL
jgi:hypothetical protein